MLPLWANWMPWQSFWANGQPLSSRCAASRQRCRQLCQEQGRRAPQALQLVSMMQGQALQLLQGHALQLLQG
jgi:hypothetical protein